MNNFILKHIIRFVVLITIQVLVLNNVLFMGYINTYIYILLLLLLPFDTTRWLILILAFCLGISVDAFQNTMGLHAFSCVLIAYCRRSILHFLLPQLKNKKHKSNYAWSVNLIEGYPTPSYKSNKQKIRAVRAF